MNRKSSAQIGKFLDENFHRLSKPSSLYGKEPNSVTKPWEDLKLRILLMASWTYKGVAGNQSIPLVACLINEAADDIYADRSFFCYSKKDWSLWKSNNMPIFGLNSRKSACEYDIVATSVAFLPHLINFVQQLIMCGIPVLEKDRREMKENYPLIMLGGYVFGNPECISPVCDIIWLGEAEDEEGNPGIQEVMRYIRNWKHVNPDRWFDQYGRSALLLKLSYQYPFLYIPRFHTPEYEDGKLVGFSRDMDLKRPKRRWVHDFDAVQASTATPISYTDTNMGMGEVEMSRGCRGSCSFCAQHFRSRPYRERSVDLMNSLLSQAIVNTGAAHAFPCGMDFSMFTQKRRLVKSLLENVISEVDTQSARVDNIAKDECFLKIAHIGGMRQLVLGVEGCSQRMRDVVNKNASVSDILKCCEFAFKNGYKRIKFYFICDIPFENKGDHQCFYELMKLIVNMRNSYGLTTQLFASFTPLRIEAFTPLQWLPAHRDSRQMGEVPHKVRELGMKVLFGPKVNPHRIYFMQIMGMADRVIGEGFVHCVEDLDMCHWGGIDKRFPEAMRAYLLDHGVAEDEYFKEKPEDFIFPWEIIDIGVSKRYLRMYYERILEFIKHNSDAVEYEADSIEQDKRFQLISQCSDCSICGVCQDIVDKDRQIVLRKQKDEDVDSTRIRVIDDTTVRQKLLFKIDVPKEWRFVEDHFKIAVFRRACYKAGFPIAKDSIILDSSSIKYDDFVSGIDYIEAGFLSSFYRNRGDFVVAKIHSFIDCFFVVDCMSVYLKFNLRKDWKDRLGFYSVNFGGIRAVVKGVLAKVLSHEPVLMKMKQPGDSRGASKIVEVNLLDYLKECFVGLGKLDYRLYFLVRGGVSPYEVLSALTGISREVCLKYNIRREEVFLPEVSEGQLSLIDNCRECGRGLRRSIFGLYYNNELCMKCKLEITLY